MTKQLSLRLNHIGVAVRDIDKAIKFLSSIGIGPFDPPAPDPPVTNKMFRGKPANDKLKFSNADLGLAQVSLELLQPVEGESPHSEFIRDKGEGINHIGFTVDDLDREVTKLTKRGFKILTCGGWPGGGFAYLENDEFKGIVIELLQGHF